MELDLAKLVVPSKTIWDEYPGFEGFEVQLAYLTRDELMKIRTKATTTKIGRKSRKPEEELDADLFQSLYIKAVIKDWKGFKLSYLDRMLPVDLSDIEDLDADLTFSVPNAEMLMKNVSGFDAWVTDVLEDVENFTQSS